MDLDKRYIQDNTYINRLPESKFHSMDDLRQAMTHHYAKGDAFLDYLLEGNYFDGKGVWFSEDPNVQKAYAKIVEQNPHLQTESPYGEHFKKDAVRVRGENEVIISNIRNAPTSYRDALQKYRSDVAAGRIKPRAIFSGGPAPKIASMLTAMGSSEQAVDVTFLYDGGEQSNESASASYEHINHANALNAEHDNTGLGILFLAIKRALFSEKDPSVALDTSYHKVDLWPHGIHLRDIPIYLYNEIHGRIQWLKHLLGIQNDHAKSRMASKVSTKVLTYIEDKLGVSLRLPRAPSRAFFLYYTKKQHRHSIKDYKILSSSIGLYPTKIERELIERYYGESAAKYIVSADLFHENHCIRHGFDHVCCDILTKLGADVRRRTLIKELYFSGAESDSQDTRNECVGMRVQNILTNEEYFIPASYVGLSLGPSATYRFSSATTMAERLADKLRISQPVPYQTIATGFSGQLLFKITDPKRFDILPHTGLKQTHFVEIGRSDDHIVIKLTSGGVIGLPVYSRSYAISAIANMLRVLGPDSGLEFVSVVTAWPGTRGVNGPNNGQIVRLADNAAVRFGEGGTGMSKMGTNAQTILDMIGLSPKLAEELMIDHSLYAHTVIDNRARIARRLKLSLPVTWVPNTEPTQKVVRMNSLE